MIEIAHHADPFGLRRPDGEAGPGDAVQGAQLRAQLLVNAVFIALTEEIQIGFTESRKEGIRIAPLRDRAIAPGEDDIISIDLLGLADDALEQSGGVNSLQFDGRAGFFVDGDDGRLPGLRSQDAHNEAGTVGQAVHAQELMRGVMPELNQAFDFCLRENHAARKVARIGREQSGKLRGASSEGLTLAESDAGLAEVVGGHFDVDLVADTDADEVLAHLAGDMGKDLMAVGQGHAKHRPWQDLSDLAV